MQSHNDILLEMLALEKVKENLRLAQQDRMIASASRNSSESIWKKIRSWWSAGEPSDRKPARV